MNSDRTGVTRACRIERDGQRSRLGILAQGSEKLRSAHRRQRKVEHDEVRTLGGGKREPRRAVSGLEDVVTGMPEYGLHQEAVVRIVVDDENRCHLRRRAKKGGDLRNERLRLDRLGDVAVESGVGDALCIARHG